MWVENTRLYSVQSWIWSYEIWRIYRPDEIYGPDIISQNIKVKSYDSPWSFSERQKFNETFIDIFT